MLGQKVLLEVFAMLVVCIYVLVHHRVRLVAIGHMFLHGRHIHTNIVLEDICNTFQSIFGSTYTIVSYNLFSNHVFVRDYVSFLLQCDLFCHKKQFG